MTPTKVIDEMLDNAYRKGWTVIEIQAGKIFMEDLITELEFSSGYNQPLNLEVREVQYNHISVKPNLYLDPKTCTIVGYPDTELGRILFK